MINHLIIVRLNNVHKDEQKTLKNYLESNYWDWKEINEETIKQDLTNDDEDEGILVKTWEME